MAFDTIAIGTFGDLTENAVVVAVTRQRTYSVMDALRQTLKAYLPTAITAAGLPAISTDPDRFFLSHGEVRHAVTEMPYCNVFKEDWSQPHDPSMATIGNTGTGGARQDRLYRIPVQFAAAADTEEEARCDVDDYVDLATGVIEYHYDLNYGSGTVVGMTYVESEGPPVVETYESESAFVAERSIMVVVQVARTFGVA